MGGRLQIGRFQGFQLNNQGNPMGERGKRALRVNFDGKLKLEFQGTTISNDAGLLV